MGIAYDKEKLIDYARDVENDSLITHEIRYVNAYVKELAWGGPEEGGWWYEVYEPISSISVRYVSDVEDVVNYLENRFLEEFDDGISTSSVASKGSLVICCEDSYAEYSPTERPHYE